MYVCLHIYIYIYGRPPRSILKGLAAKPLPYKHIISLYGSVETPQITVFSLSLLVEYICCNCKLHVLKIHLVTTGIR